MGYRPMDEWVVVDDMHEAIIDRQTWDIVQEKIQSRKRPDSGGYYSIFSGLIKCADCGKTCTIRYNSQRRRFYSCLTYNRYGKSHCSSHSIFYNQLYDAVLKDIQECAKIALADEEAAAAALQERFSQSQNTEEMQARLSAAEKRQQELENMVSRLYQDRMAGRLSESNFSRMMADTQRQQEDVERQIAQLRDRERCESENQAKMSRWIEMIRHYKSVKKLDARMLNELVSKIIVHNPELIDGELVQNIDIHYTFEVESSITEMYTLMRYLQYDTLQRMEMGHFDAWAANFGETVTAIEVARNY